MDADAARQAFSAALLDLGDQLLNIDDPAAMGYAAAAIAGSTLGVCRAGYGTLDAARGVVDVARDWTAPGTRSLAGQRRFMDDTAYRDRLARGEPILYADVARDAPAQSAQAWLAVGARSVINLPVFEHGVMVAVLYLHHPQPRAWAADEIAFLRNLADRTRSAVERRRAERALRQLNETLERQVAERTADRNRLWRLSAELMLVCQDDGVILAVNPAWRATLGWDDADLVGRTTLDLFHPDDRADSARNLAGLSEGVPVAGAVRRMRHRDGSFRRISWNSIPGGGVVSAVGRDLTVEHEKAAALEASEARLRAIFETSFQFMGMLSLDGVLLDTNKASLKAIGAQLEDVVGQEFWRTPWFAGVPELAAQVQAAIPRVAAGERFRQEVTASNPRGNRRTYDLSMRPARDAAGTVVAIVPEALDLTERRLAEEQLRQALKMEAVGQLTGGVAHDFNNLLQAISGSLELSQRRMAQGRLEEAGRFVEAARATVERAAALTHRLLAFARRQALAPKAVAPDQLIAGMTELISRTTGPAVELVVRPGEQVWPVLCDPNQLENALLNLAINARDAMAGHGRLEIRTAPARLAAADLVDQEGAAPGDYVEIAVTDTGAGMDEPTRARAFEPFFTTKKLGEGSGLGLSQIYGFVSQSGGMVRIESALGRGTTVRLYLPRHAGPAAAGEASQAAEAAAGAAGRTVLLVEDEAGVRSVLAEHLRDLGYAVTEAGDGEAALRLLRQGGVRADVVVTDIGLPGGLDGRQLADALRAEAQGLPVLLVTGYAGRALERELPAGIGVLAKPFRFGELAARLQGLLGQE